MQNLFGKKKCSRLRKVTLQNSWAGIKMTQKLQRDLMISSNKVTNQIRSKIARAGKATNTLEFIIG